jgi:hypothetical protein
MQFRAEGSHPDQAGERCVRREDDDAIMQEWRGYQEWLLAHCKRRWPDSARPLYPEHTNGYIRALTGAVHRSGLGGFREWQSLRHCVKPINMAPDPQSPLGIALNRFLTAFGLPVSA